MKEARFSLGTKITFFTIFIIISSIVFTSIFFSIWAVENVKRKISVNNMNTAINIGNAPYFGDLLDSGDPDGIIQDYTYKLLGVVEDIDMIVVANMEGIRFAHPNIERLGHQFVGGDERRVVDTGESYISEATGTLGRSLRAFAPIKNSKGEQVGFIMVGTLVEGVIADQNKALNYIVLYSMGGLVLGILGSIVLTYNIKKSLLGLEPYQISRLYTEKDSMLEAIQEGIISIDHNKEITMINDAAREILGIEDKYPIGRKIYEMFPDSGLEEVLETGISEIEKEEEMNGINIVINIVPIIHKKKIIGAMATFRDKTEVTRLAEEITGFNEIVQALRANSHEFLNKLHVVLGLIQIGELDQAKKYILGIKEQQEQIITSVMKKIKDPVIAGLILGKFSRAKELGVSFELEQSSFLDKLKDKNKNTALVTILGNFIENGLEATAKDSKNEKKVILSLHENEKNIEIEVQDTGIGIEDADMNRIFDRGFSTNTDSRGIGLSLVKEKVESLCGEIIIDSVLGEGTNIKAIIPKEAGQ